MKNKNRKNKQNTFFKSKSFFLLVGIYAIGAIVIGGTFVVFKSNADEQAQDIAVKSVASEILADGVVTAQNQATLHFQAGGKLVYLPVKEGQTVTQGQTIASLDMYALQKQLAAALNTYRSTRDTFDQTQQNAGQQGQTNNVLQNEQQKLTGEGNTSYLNDVAKRIVDQNQANLDNSVIQVQLATYAEQLSTLTSPINGVITHLDVTTPNVNVSPTTSFVIQDPSSIVFRAYVSENDIDYVSVGSSVSIKLDGGKQLTGTVDSISPDKVTSPTGQSAYQVDVTSDDLVNQGKIGQSGSVIIKSNTQSDVTLVPTWTILNDDQLWVTEDGKTVLKKVTVGKAHGNMTEITGGLTPDDKVILNPKSVITGKYPLL